MAITNKNHASRSSTRSQNNKTYSRNKAGQELMTTLRFKSSTSEWVVRCWIDEKRRESMDYFTTDETDSRQTETAMHNSWKEQERYEPA